MLPCSHAAYIVFFKRNRNSSWRCVSLVKMLHLEFEVVACFAEDFIRGAFLSGRDSATVWVKETLTEEEKYEEETLETSRSVLTLHTLDYFRLYRSLHCILSLKHSFKVFLTAFQT